jgi:hypothetical protein
MLPGVKFWKARDTAANAACYLLSNQKKLFEEVSCQCEDAARRLTASEIDLQSGEVASTLVESALDYLRPSARSGEFFGASSEKSIKSERVLSRMSGR